MQNGGTECIDNSMTRMVCLSTHVTPYAFFTSSPLHAQFAATHSYSWMERGTVRVKFLAKEHTSNTRTRAGTLNS